ncbi:MAG: hypothetical protein HYR51_02465 [Candidatus Rokubacteria bacterium]|nr:hypothetical protein [Candidatus Rokubacteria bacterium]
MTSTRSAAENLLAAIDTSRRRGLARLLTGLGIPLARLAAAGVHTRQE